MRLAGLIIAEQGCNPPSIMEVLPEELIQVSMGQKSMDEYLPRHYERLSRYHEAMELN
jgi:hypothetical protein